MSLNFDEHERPYETRSGTPSLCIELENVSHLFPYQHLSCASYCQNASRIEAIFGDIEIKITGESLTDIWEALAKYELSKLSVRTSTNHDRHETKITSIIIEPFTKVSAQDD